MGGRRSKRGTGATNPNGGAVPVVKSVERAARIMAVLWLAREGRGLAQLSQELGMHKTTVLRLLRTLVAIGMAEKDQENDTYHWYPVRWITFTYSLGEIISTADTVQEMLDEVAVATRAAVNLAVPDTQRDVMVVSAWGRLPTMTHLQPKQRLAVPMHATAVGRIYLASLPQAYLEEHLPERLPKTTEHTITSRRGLLEELARVRQHGYAVSRQEFLPGTAAVAVPVRDAKGRTVTAIAAWGLTEMLTEASIRRWVPLLRRASARLSQLLPPRPLRASRRRDSRTRQ